MPTVDHADIRVLGPPYLFPSDVYPQTMNEGPCGLLTTTRVAPLTGAAPLSNPWILIPYYRLFSSPVPPESSWEAQPRERSPT
jgi:hypothetical protein